MSEHPVCTPTAGLCTPALDAATRAVLTYRTKGEVAIVEAEHGPCAFDTCPEAIAAHEASHAAVGASEGLRIVRVEIFDTPRRGRSATSLMDEWRGLTTSRGLRPVTALSHPADDLRNARMALAGRVGELMSEHGNLGAALDELVLSQWMADAAARKLGVDGEKLWRAEVRKPVKAILRANRGVVDAIAARLLSDGCVSGRRLREILADVRSSP